MRQRAILIALPGARPPVNFEIAMSELGVVLLPKTG